MKPELGSPFSPEWEGIPPAMPTGDLGIWLRYRTQLVGMYDKVYFNVRVGEPVPIPEGLPPEIEKMAIETSRRRIDVVAEGILDWLLIELKFQASADALGQILMYRALWLSDPPDNRPVSMAIVSDRENKDLKIACQFYNIKLIVV